ncbi:MAG: fused response regulator/phosphatase [Gammaproteobacteria bacterium]
MSAAMQAISNSLVRTNTKGKALVADDERSNRLILCKILQQIGYEVVQAGNGSEAVQLFKSETPDIILMDVMMPVMDGYDAVKEIKSISTDVFTPVIFLTGVTDEHDLAKCIEVGGDDFLTKPFSPTLLTAKIHAMERFSQLHREVNTLYARTQQDQLLAEGVFAGAVIADNVALNTIHTLLQPAELFSGDVLLTAYSPSGDLNLLMGDFTGHGLAAALGAMPASEVFRAMTSKGFSIQQIVAGINSKLLSVLPTGMFLAMQFVTISNSLDYVSICNCGMPDVLFLQTTGNKITYRSSSQCMPLGISRDVDYNEYIEVVKISPDDRILLVTDGLTEAINSNQEQFGISRLEDAITKRRDDESFIDSISSSLQQFCGDASQMDDITLAEIPCIPDLLQKIKPEQLHKSRTIAASTDVVGSNAVVFSIALHGARLCDADPIPLLLSHIHEIEGLSEHRRLLFTILTELYTNAVDHGVLELDSSIKDGKDGFTHYFTEREKRLEELTDGYVRITVSYYPTSDGGEMMIKVEDSGPGFDFSHLKCDSSDISRLSGRGIQLLSELCRSVTYLEPGNQVEAVYAWNNH